MTNYIVTASAATDVGLVRTTNEDCLHVAGWSSSLSGARLAVDAPPRSVLAVIDGMGGQPGGDLASWTAARELGELRLGNVTAPDDITQRIQRLSDHVRKQGQSTQGHALMGATIAGLVVLDTSLILFNVGDSSILRVSGDYVGELAELDRVGEHSVGQCLGGTRESTAVDAHPYEYAPAQPETLVLCSDGLTCCVPPERITALAADASGMGLARALVAAAIEAGAPDNVSVIVVDVVPAVMDSESAVDLATPLPHDGSGAYEQ